MQVKWRDIKSAPLNEAVIVFVPDRDPQVRLAIYNDFWKFWLDTPYSSSKNLMRPTKWMPKPKPPTT
jgi:hypothetical protein